MSAPVRPRRPVTIVYCRWYSTNKGHLLIVGRGLALTTFIYIVMYIKKCDSKLVPSVFKSTTTPIVCERLISCNRNLTLSFFMYIWFGDRCIFFGDLIAGLSSKRLDYWFVSTFFRTCSVGGVCTRPILEIFTIWVTKKEEVKRHMWVIKEVTSLVWNPIIRKKYTNTVKELKSNTKLKLIITHHQ